jgi:4-cresol dehydrogenase (hydroxylating)
MTTEPSALSVALGEWRSALGADQVRTAPEELARVGHATFATEARIAAIVRPASRAEVQATLRIASRYRIAVYR